MAKTPPPPRRRASLSGPHLIMLEKAFVQHHMKRPPRDTIAQLADAAGIDFQRVYNWFGNRLSRCRVQQHCDVDGDGVREVAKDDFPPNERGGMGLSHPRLSAQRLLRHPCHNKDDDCIPIPLPVPIPVPFLQMPPQPAHARVEQKEETRHATPSRSGTWSAAAEGGAAFEEETEEGDTRLAAEHMLRLLVLAPPFTGPAMRQCRSVVQALTQRMMQFRTLEAALPHYFHVPMIVWGSLPDAASSMAMRNTFVAAHAEVASRFRSMDEYMEAALRPPHPADDGSAFWDGSWAYLVECYSRYRCDFEVQRNPLQHDVSRLRPQFVRVAAYERPENSILENIKSRAVFEMERLLCEREQSVSLDYFVSAFFCCCLSLVTSNVGVENLCDRQLAGEISQLRFALDFCFLHPQARIELASHHVRMLLGSLAVLKSGLALPRPVHRPSVSLKAMLMQIRGQFSSQVQQSLLQKMPPARLYELVAQQVGTSPTRPTLADPLFQRFFHLCEMFDRAAAE